MILGIDQRSEFVYESISTCGGRLLPSPCHIVQAGIGDSLESAVQALYDSNYVYDFNLIFREESHSGSPRRGRLYRSATTLSKPHRWLVYPNLTMPYEIEESKKNSGFVSKDLYSFESVTLEELSPNWRKGSFFMAFGTRSLSEIWLVEAAEIRAGGEQVLSVNRAETRIKEKVGFLALSTIQIEILHSLLKSPNSSYGPLDAHQARTCEQTYKDTFRGFNRRYEKEDFETEFAGLVEIPYLIKSAGGGVRFDGPKALAWAEEQIKDYAFAMQEKEAGVKPSPVPLEISSLHSEVQKVAGKLVAGGHYRQAITDTFILLDTYVQKKSLCKESGTKLMTTVFSANDPILEIADDTEAQTGFMMLFTGAIKAIRNQYAHSLIDPKTKEEALEWLGFSSALLRLVDRAKKN